MTRKITRMTRIVHNIAPFIAVLTAMIAIVFAQTGAAGQSRLVAGPMGLSPLLFMPVVDFNSGGAGAMSVAVADVNGDGRPDLIVANNCGDGTC